MRSINIKNLASVTSLAMALAMGVTAASAQGHNQRNSQQDRNYQQQQKIDEQNRKIEQDRQKHDRQQPAVSDRYRVNRGGQWHNVDKRQSELLKQAINAGYKQGFQAGRADRTKRRHSSWSSSSVYQSGTYGYQPYVNQSMYQYYFQQGFERGYKDGYNSRNQYGNGNGGNVLSSIMQGILGLQRY